MKSHTIRATKNQSEKEGSRRPRSVPGMVLGSAEAFSGASVSTATGPFETAASVTGGVARTDMPGFR
jgi:hypothetical protein